MESTFDTTAWVMQSLLIMLAALLIIPLLRAILGLALISLSAGLGFERSTVHDAGVSLLPTFLRTALGFATAVALVQPQIANAAEPPRLVIDRIVSTPSPATPKVIVFDDEEVPALQPSETPDASATDDVYIVKVGDSLWTIARGLIAEPNPSARVIDRTWRALWEANRAAIGADPSLIRPGTRLKLEISPVAHEH